MKREYCTICGVEAGKRHHDPMARGKIATMHTIKDRGERRRVCMLCRDGIYAMRKAGTAKRHLQIERLEIDVENESWVWCTFSNRIRSIAEGNERMQCLARTDRSGSYRLIEVQSVLKAGEIKP